MKKYLAINLIILFLVLSAGCQTIPETIEPSPEKMPIPTIESTAIAVKPNPTATEKVMTLSEKVEAFANGSIEFPTDPSKEDYDAFIDEMNNYVGRQPIWVEGLDSKTGAAVVLYYDVAKNIMVVLPGSYAENKAVIDHNVLEMFVKIAVEPGTGNIQFTNSSGELVTSPNSAGTDWNLRVDETNYKDGLIDLPTAIGSTIAPEEFWGVMLGDNLKSTLIPGILMDKQASRVVSRQGGWNRFPCLDILFIKTDAAGNPIYGIRTMVGRSMVAVGEEGGTLDMKSRNILQDTEKGTKNFDAGSVYYVLIDTNQQKLWDDYMKSDIDELQGVDSESNSFDNTFNQDVPNGGNIILGGSVFIKKK